MHPDTSKVSEHMRSFGLSTLGRAVVDTTFAEIARPYAHALAVGHAAHGAEIVLKARIAQEHPLLIFEQLPKSKKAEDLLTIVELLEHGRTLMYSDLPERLWATTGARMERAAEFVEFGKLRNRIIHLAVPNADVVGATLRFVFEVMDPLVYEFWGESIVPYAEEWDDVVACDGYLGEQLERLGVTAIPSTQVLL